MNRLTFFFSFLIATLLVACGSHNGEDGHNHGVGGHSHAHEDLVESHTIWTGKTELFVEFKPLVVGEVSTFSAHFSELERFKPVEKGKVTVSLVKGGKGIRQTVESPSSPGIFLPALKPKEPGLYQLIFDLNSPELKDRITVENVRVHGSMAAAEEALPHEEEDPNGISFLKERAWKIDFASAEARYDTLYEIIRTGGEFMATRGNEKTVSATASGILLYKKRNVNIGSSVSNRELLFAVAGGGIIDKDLEARFMKARSVLAKTQAVHERKTELYEANAIAKSEYEEAVLAYEVAQAEYEALSNSYSKGGKSIYAPQGGYLKQLYKTEGSFVEAGEPLALITENKTVTLRADVGPEYFGRLNGIHSANFISNHKTYSLADLDGRLLSYGKSVSRDHPKVPVYFELANTADLLPGSFVEVFIQLRPSNSALLIPVSALLEEYGKYTVIVQSAGERFEERDIQIGMQNGRDVEVLDGLKAGDRVVTVGAYQVKMAAMSGTVPSHGHSH